MKFKSYLKFLIKKYIPLIVIASALVLIYVISTVSNATFHQTLYYDSYFGDYVSYYSSGPTTGILTFVIIFIVVMTFLPFFGMGYRYSLKSSDTYRQAPVKSKRIRWFDNLFLISVAAIIFTIGFFLMFAFLAIYYHNYELPTSNSADYMYIKYNVYFGYYFVSYLLILVFGLIQYGFSYLLISRGNTVYSSITMLILGEIVLGFFFIAPCYYISVTGARFDSSNNFSEMLLSASGNLTTSGSFISVIYVLYQVCNSLISKGQMPTLFSTNNATNITELVFFIILLVIFVCLGVLGFVAMFLEKDPSGEFAGKPGSDKPYQEIIFHTGFVYIGLLCATFTTVSESLAIGLLSVVGGLAAYGAAYYIFYSLLYKNFRLPIRKYIPMFSIAGVTLVLSLIITIAYVLA